MLGKWCSSLFGIFGIVAFGVAVGQASDTDMDPTRKRLGSIRGYKFLDENRNGIDDEEPRLPGFGILVEGEGPEPFSRNAVTNENGEYHFTKLPLQSYLVCEVALPPWVPTTPECVRVSLGVKQSRATVLFGNYRPQPQPTPTPGVGCTRTQGYWGSSPAGQALVPILVPNTLNLGNRGYTATELDSVLDGNPTGGNALVSLAHQLIAAKLNILANANGDCISNEITQADAAIGNLVVPPVGSGFVHSSTPLGQTMSALATGLDQYNKGNRCATHCP